MKLDILAFGAHPDDVELSCSGTLLKHIEMGKKVGLIDLTRGELGTRGTAELRDQEAENSRIKMKALVRENLRMADGFFEVNEENLKSVVTMIRKYQPEIVLANSISDRHPDHGRGAELVSRACFLSGLVKIETKVADGPQGAWRPKAVYHYIQDYNLKPDFVVDVSPYMDQKIELVLTFSSQFYNPNSDGPETPISTKGFMDFIRSKGATYGRHIGAEYGEGFTCDRYIGVNNLFDLQ